MKNSLWKIVVAILAFVLAATVIVGVLPSSDKDEEATTKKPGVTDTDPGTDEPGVSTLSWPTSDLIKASFASNAKNAAWTKSDPEESSSRWVYTEGSASRVALPESFVLPEEEKLLFRWDDRIQARLRGMAWFNRLGSVTYEEFKTSDTAQSFFVFRHPTNAEVTPEYVMEHFQVYTRSDIQKNLQQENLSNEHLNELINFLAAPGMYRESSIDQVMYWVSDYSTGDPSIGFNGNRVCMRYSVSVPCDVKVSIPSDLYDYTLYLFKSLDSMQCSSTVGWKQAGGEFVIPANTPFCIALRPHALAGIDEDEFGYDLDRDLYPYIYATEWDNIISFELVK